MAGTDDATAAWESGVAQLRLRYPWPSTRPPMPADAGHGWFGGGNRKLLKQHLSANTRLVVELGSWRGLSTRWIAAQAPYAVVIAIDHWAGSPEHHDDPTWSAMLPDLYRDFLAESWDYRDQIIPLRADTLSGMREVHAAGLRPSLVYVDAAHETPAVLADLQEARALWPRVRLVGDDWTWPSVREAVEAFHQSRGGTLDVKDNAWDLSA